MPVATTSDLTALIDRFGRINLGGLDVDVLVKDSRVRFGHVDVLIQPCAGGESTVWVEAARIAFND